MKRAARIDRNQREIVAGLRRVGAGVLLLFRLGEGAPDILVTFRDVLYLMEIKMPGCTLTHDEALWIGAWPGRVYIVRSVAEALEVIGAEVKGGT